MTCDTSAWLDECVNAGALIEVHSSICHQKTRWGEPVSALYRRCSFAAHDIDRVGRCEGRSRDGAPAPCVAWDGVRGLLGPLFQLHVDFHQVLDLHRDVYGGHLLALDGRVRVQLRTLVALLLFDQIGELTERRTHVEQVAIKLKNQRLYVAPEHRKMLLIRCFVGFSSMGFSFYAVSQMVLADASVIIFTSPVFTFFMVRFELRRILSC